MFCSARQLSACSEAAQVVDAADDSLEEFRERLRRGPGLSHFTQAASASTQRPVAARTGSKPHSAPTALTSVQRALQNSTDQLLALVAKLEKQERLAPMAVGSLLTDTHGRRHNYLRISLTERCNLVSHSSAASVTCLCSIANAAKVVLYCTLQELIAGINHNCCMQQLCSILICVSGEAAVLMFTDDILLMLMLLVHLYTAAMRVLHA
jgi:hypothetical protein